MQHGAAQRRISRSGALVGRGERDQLSERQLTAIEMLIAGHSDIRVAEQVGVDRVTVLRWRTKLPPFRKQLAERRQAVYDQSADRIRTAMLPAIDLLTKQIAEADKNPAGAQRAAALLLKLAMPRGLAPPPTPDDDRRRPPPRDPYANLDGEALVEAILADARRREEAEEDDVDDDVDVDDDLDDM